METKCLGDTHTALVEIGNQPASETRGLSEDVCLDPDAQGNAVSLTIEHASLRSDLSQIAFQRLGKGPSPQAAPSGWRVQGVGHTGQARIPPPLRGGCGLARVNGGLGRHPLILLEVPALSKC